MATQFRIRASKLFLTYPQIGQAPAQQFLDRVQDWYGNDVIYCVCGEERHADGGRHVHLLVLLKKVVNTKNNREWDITMGDGRVLHPHVEGAKAPKDVREYCKKDGVFKEIGEWPYKETLTKSEKNRLIKDTPIETLIEDGTISMMNVRTIEIAKVILTQKAQEQIKPVPKVFWFWGPTGSGKTRAAVAISDDYWISGSDLRWFQGYHNQKVAILDDLRVASCSFQFLLRLLDRYKLQVEIKGASVWWNPEIIVITCPVTPKELYTNHVTGEVWDNEDQLERRITRQVEFPTADDEHLKYEDMINSIEED